MKKILLLTLVMCACLIQAQTLSAFEKLTSLPLIEDSSQIIIFEVSPNPIIDEAIVKYKLPQGIQLGKIIVFNLMGNPISDYEIIGNEGTPKLSLSDLSQGIYFLRLETGKYGKTNKIIVQ